MQERTDDQTTRTTGRGYNRHTTDPDRAATGAATDLYSPVPGDDDDTRPGMVGSDRAQSSAPVTTSTTTQHEHRSADIRSASETTDDYRQPTQTTSRPSSAYTMRSRSQQSDGGIMQKIQENPLAVVAAATAGGMLVGRMMRSRGHQDSPGYLRSGFGNQQNYQRYPSPQPYRQPQFQPYQVNPGYQGYQGNQSYQGPGGYQGYQGYQNPGGYQGAPQYRSDQEYRPDQGFEGRHENFPGGSNWD